MYLIIRSWWITAMQMQLNPAKNRHFATDGG
jgi:hypothetical protein